MTRPKTDRSIAIQLDDVWKKYRLGTVSHGMLYRDFQSWWARVRGKPDPNSKVNFGGGEAVDVSAGGGYFWAVSALSVSIGEGEVLGIIGRNGAGKSTLLKLISSITAPTRGRIRLRGRVASLLEVGTGFHPELTGRENVFLNGTILGMSRLEIRSKFDEIVEFAGVGQFIDTPVKRYSSGMRVRLAFAVAAHLDPEILLVDEVLAVGDASFQEKCVGKMNEVSRAQGRTVVFVSHNMGAIANICSRCLLLEQGKLIMEDTPNRVIDHYLTSSYRSSRLWESTGSNGKPMQLLRCQVLSERGSLSEELDVRRPFAVQLEYVVRRPLWGANVAVNIHAADGTHLLSLEDIDQDPQLRGRREPGQYRAMVRIPGLWLNHGRYYVRIGCGMTSAEVFENHEALQIELVETGEAVARGHRAGHLLPMLPWVVETITDPQPGFPSLDVAAKA